MTQTSLDCCPDLCTPAASDGTIASPDALARLAKALAHPARVQILQILLARDGCVCGDLVLAMPLAQSTISQHLKVMKGAGLICGTIDGPRVCYCVRPEAMAELKGMIAAL